MEKQPAIESTTVKRDQLIKACEALGIDSNQVARIHILPDEIYVSTFTLDDEGRRILADGGEGSEYEKSCITLKVV